MATSCAFNLMNKRTLLRHYVEGLRGWEACCRDAAFPVQRFFCCSLCLTTKTSAILFLKSMPTQHLTHPSRPAQAHTIASLAGHAIPNKGWHCT